MLSLIGWGLRYMWKTHKRQMEKTAQALKVLAEAVDANEGIYGLQVAAIKESVMALRAEAAITSKTTQDALGRVLELGGVVRMQQAELKEANGLLQEVSGKMTAIFRFIDAPRRATDKG